MSNSRIIQTQQLYADKPPGKLLVHKRRICRQIFHVCHELKLPKKMTYFVPTKGVKSAKNRKMESHKLEGIKIRKYLWMKFERPQAPSRYWEPKKCFSSWGNWLISSPGCSSQCTWRHATVLEELNFPCQLQHKGYQLHPSGYHRHKGSEISLCQQEKCDACNVLSSDLNAIRRLIQQSSQQTARKIIFLDGNCGRTDCSFHPAHISSLPSTQASTFTSRSFSPLICWLWRGWLRSPWDQSSLLPCLQEEKCSWTCEFVN